MPGTIAPCGIDCGQCGYHPTDCAGCAAIQGKAFWLAYTGEGICGIYDCCVNQNHFPHCGRCQSLPWARFDLDDPTKPPEENAADHRRMMETLNALREREEDHV